MNKKIIWFLVIMICPTVIGCAGKKVTYVATGSAIGAGAGYAVNEDAKDAVIGGLAGGITGSIIADIHNRRETKKYNDGYELGYTQAQLHMALKDWEENTGKQKEDNGLKSYQRIKLPKREVNDIVYESHYETMEVYR